jgi:hypothetical protein
MLFSKPILKILSILLLLAGMPAFGQIGFQENKGQFDNPIDFRANFGSHVIFLDNDGFSVLLYDEQTWSDVVTHLHDHHTRDEVDSFEMPSKLKMQHIKYELVGANLSEHTALSKQTSHYNYFLGNDPSRWASDVGSYDKVLYKNIYPNIDLEYECIDKRFKYNFILNKGSDIEDIQLKILGADSFSVAADRITIYSRFGQFSEVMPLSYEEANGERRQINMSYEERGDFVGFKTAFFKTKVKTVIDPELIFSTYSGSTSDNFGYTATFDSDGGLYAGGSITSPTTVRDGRYPATPGSFDETFNGGDTDPFDNRVNPWDIAISKYSPDGSVLEYATYLGGERNEFPHSLIVTDDKELVIFGTSASTNYPTTVNAYSSVLNGGVDIVVTKFSAEGSRLIGSTFVGGAQSDGRNSQIDMNSYYADEYRGEVNLDENDNILIASCTYSDDFPTTSGAFQNSNNGSQEGVVFSLNKDLSALRWSTYLGGIDAESVYGIDLMSDGNLLISGSTTSSDMPTHSGAYQEEYQGGSVDGFVARINKDGTNLLACTYFGTSSYDQVLASESDRNNNIYIAGHSRGSMPVQGSVYSNADGKQFIAKLANDLNSILVSTVYGSGRSETDLTINALLVDNCDRVYVSGWGTNFDLTGRFRLENMPLTPDAFQSTTDGQDFHIMVLEEDLSDILYGTYFGGSRTDDHVDGGTSRFDKRGAIYQSVCSSCPAPLEEGGISDFPTSVGAYSENNPSPRCSNASFKIQVVPVNEEPVMGNPVFRANILEELSFDYTITDPERDSLFVAYTIRTRLNSYMSKGKPTDTSEERSVVDFAFRFDCSSAGDTFTIPVEAFDAGCPFPEDNDGLITIIVDTVPVLPPPGVLCLNFGRNNELRIDWDSTPQSGYFKRMLLYKIDPAGSRTVLHYINIQGEGSYTDFDVEKPRENNYTYYLAVENICGQFGERTYELNSVKESEIPISPTYIITATVVQDSVRIDFERSTEDDFSSYEIYRKIRGSKEFSYLESIFDIDKLDFIDKDALVNEFSYCYVVKVLDDCGNISSSSNEGCSIVIRGVAQNKKGRTPRYYMDLYWDDYIDWQDGVSRYELLRSVDTGNLKPIVSLNSPSLEFTDGKLDYDWGGYWYSVLAYENNGEHNALSRSNDIYLIQPPEVFVPNAVTLNNDGLNDSFGWADVFVKEFTMDIYNRWGEKVFSTTDKNNRWSSVYKDGDLKYSNVYMWIVSYSGWDSNRHYDSGTVTFLK